MKIDDFLCSTRFMKSTDYETFAILSYSLQNAILLVKTSMKYPEYLFSRVFFSFWFAFSSDLVCVCT